MDEGNSNDQNETDKNELLRELGIRLDWAGISNPHNNVYIKSPNINNIALIMFLLTVLQLPKLYYCKNTGNLNTPIYLIHITFT